MKSLGYKICEQGRRNRNSVVGIPFSQFYCPSLELARIPSCALKFRLHARDPMANPLAVAEEEELARPYK
jgi:hypothetical protein